MTYAGRKRWLAIAILTVLAAFLGRDVAHAQIKETGDLSIELVDPKVQAELKRKRQADEDRYFKGGTFTQVSGSGSNNNNGTFKVPGQPPSKKVDTGSSKSNGMAPPPVPSK